MQESSKNLITSFDKLPTTEPLGKASQKESINLRDFVEYYVTNLPNLIRAFPKDGNDLGSLESHYWDRLKHFYHYGKFSEIEISKKEEVEFINQAIVQIQQWFYNGNWTSCLKTPTAEEVKSLLGSRKHSHLKAGRAKNSPNLGRDVRGRGEPLPDIYKDMESNQDPVAVWQEHAFKFFHNPASAINTLTKMHLKNPGAISINTGRRDNLIKGASEQAFKLLGGSSKNFARVKRFEKSIRQGFYSRLQPYEQELYFLKNCMVAAELLRRHDGVLTPKVFEEIMLFVDSEMAKPKRPGEYDRYFVFNFAPGSPHSRSSMLHVNPEPLPMSLFAVENLRRTNSENVDLITK